MSKKFLSGDEAFAYGIRLARPDVISAYPITPQTVVVEKLSDFVEDGSLKSNFIHVESEHSALSCAMGVSAAGARAFTATSSQGLLYMAECLVYASGGRFPIVMMNANRSTALPWNIYGDQRDSLALLDSGWIQSYAQDGQEALDMALMSYYIAEHKKVQTPFMVNLDGFVLTHTYEVVDVPEQAQADEFLPSFETENKFDFESPKNLAFSAGPETNTFFKVKEHLGLLNASAVISEAEERFAKIFGRKYSGLTENYKTEDADYIILTLGSVSGLIRQAVDELRDEGLKAGLVRIRYMRPFPVSEISAAVKNAKALAVLEKDVSFGAEGTVYTNVNSALKKNALEIPSKNFIGGLGGKDISLREIKDIFLKLKDVSEGQKLSDVNFLGVDVKGE
ncbi:pyruvate ferredoxin oxidoreductase alpha subunit [Treponema rectale]|uniref:Pyruvate ferredoxin oxidoreductase alpha subunit n=1 Tax=Treponema rectale TaxID=744512 RepID=A0A840SGV7_9SPIR|nr:transketolase C-terminal domain-containing protein [Treponema rectale]MBB5219935.1 pyruvate ferredoxin oxidoreductase alpha subunit [Treponema rectale]